MKLIVSCFIILFILSCNKEKTNINPNLYIKENVNIIGNNGIVEHQNLLWIADLVGSNIIGINTKGKIIAAYSKRILGSGADDLCFIDDTTFVWTSFFTAQVKKTTLSGYTTILANNIKNVNPIAKVPNERAVLVASSVGENIALIKINADNLQQEIIVDNIQGINGFDINNKGILYAPIFNIDAVLGNGKIVKIDTKNKTSQIVEPIFIDEPNKKGYNSPTGICYNQSGEKIYILESFGKVSVYEYELATNESIKIFESNKIVADNICMSKNGNLYITTFIGNTIIEIQLNGKSKEIKIIN